MILVIWTKWCKTYSARKAIPLLICILLYLLFITFNITAVRFGSKRRIILVNFFHEWDYDGDVARSAKSDDYSLNNGTQSLESDWTFLSFAQNICFLFSLVRSYFSSQDRNWHKKREQFCKASILVWYKWPKRQFKCQMPFFLYTI